MAMNDAFKFLARCRTDELFRADAYRKEGPGRFRSFIASSGFHFMDSELEDALRGMELKSADEFEAEEIKELGQWYRIMTATEMPSHCSSCKKAR